MVCNVLINVFMVLLLGAMLFLSCRDFIAIPKLFRAYNGATEEVQPDQDAPDEDK